MADVITLSRTASRLAATLFVLALLSACGALPPRAEPPLSSALPASADSPIARVAAASTPPSASTGFRLMPLAYYSLDARVELARRARHSLDVQYYLIQDDRSGRLFMRSLRDAALRGVRVRLLVDDLNTAGADPLFQGLAAFENVAVRLFNPVLLRACECHRPLRGVARRPAAAESPHAQQALHRRRRDGRDGRPQHRRRVLRAQPEQQLRRHGRAARGQRDSPARGHLRHLLGQPQAYPLDTILGPTANVEQTRSAYNALVDEGDQMMAVPVPRMDMLGQRPIGQDLDAGRLDLAWGTATAFADQPAKVMATSMEQAHAMSVQMNLLDRVMTATHRVIISSPYFVPGRMGVEAFAALEQRGVNVVILTNSLAANDVPLVHIGYARYRPDLLRTGVELYELSPAGVHRSDVDTFPGMSHGRLHAKAAVIDDAMVYIGSMNLDPRSESTNTELGLFARCPELARDIAYVIDASRLQSSYRLRFGPDGTSLEWIATRGSESVVLTSEPEVTPAMRLRNMLLGPFVPEQLL